MTEEEKKRLEALAAAQGGASPEMANTVTQQESAMPTLKQKAEEQPSVPVAHSSLSAPEMANTVTTQESAMPAMKQKAATEDKMFIPGMGFRHFGTQELAAIRQNWNNRPEDPDKYQERMKREARNKMFASLGDTVAEIGNLVNTTQYSPNIEYKTSLSERQQAMYDRLTAERNAREKKFNDAVTKARLQDIETELKKKEQKRKEESDKAAAEYRKGLLDLKERENAWKRDPNNPDYAKREDQARKAAADADTAEVRSQYAESQARATLAKTNRTGTGRSSGGNSQKEDYVMGYASMPDEYKVKDKYGDLKTNPTKPEMELAYKTYLNKVYNGGGGQRQSGWRDQSTQIRKGNSSTSGGANTKKHNLIWN